MGHGNGVHFGSRFLKRKWGSRLAMSANRVYDPGPTEIPGFEIRRLFEG